MNKRMAIGVAALVLVLASCGSSGSDASSSDGGSSKTTAASGGSSGGGGTNTCKGYTSGKDGVIRTFCDGPATAKVKSGGKEYEIEGGTCVSSGGYYAVNIGVVVDQSFSGTKPDYFGGLFPEKEGDFSGDKVSATFTVDGTGTVVRDLKGTRDSKTITFSGTPYGEDGTVSGTVTC